MIVEVEMRAFPLCGTCGRTHDERRPPDHEQTLAIRKVDVPDRLWTMNTKVDAQLERVFYWGQNDFQPQQNRYSVSVGDVVRHPNGKRYRVEGCGFEEANGGD